MNKKLVTLVSFTLSACLAGIPLLAMAIADPSVPQTIVGLSVIQLVNVILSFLWPVFIGFAVIMFIIAGFYFITAQGEPEGVAKARQFIIYGIVGVAVGVLAFSLPYVVQTTICTGGRC